MGVLAQYYQLPWLSFRDMVYPLWARNATGFGLRDFLEPEYYHITDKGHRYICLVTPRSACCDDVVRCLLCHSAILPGR